MEKLEKAIAPNPNYPTRSRLELENEDAAKLERYEDALARIYHETSCTTMQFEIIEEVLPQKK